MSCICSTFLNYTLSWIRPISSTNRSRQLRTIFSLNSRKRILRQRLDRMSRGNLEPDERVLQLLAFDRNHWRPLTRFRTAKPNSDFLLGPRQRRVFVIFLNAHYVNRNSTNDACVLAIIQ